MAAAVTVTAILTVALVAVTQTPPTAALVALLFAGHAVLLIPAVAVYVTACLGLDAIQPPYRRGWQALALVAATVIAVAATTPANGAAILTEPSSALRIAALAAAVAVAGYTATTRPGVVRDTLTEALK